MRIITRTDKGMVRYNNEDSLLVNEEMGIILIADGMGGHQAGEVASALAVNIAYRFLEEGLKKGIKEIGPLIYNAMLEANKGVLEEAEGNPGLKGMGTTLIIGIIEETSLYLCHVGDSRVYIIDGGIKQVTKDHTVGVYLLEQKLMEKHEIPPYKWHTLTQAVGISQDIAPEMHRIELKIGEVVLFCTDGLTEMLDDEEIRDIIVRTGFDLDVSASALVERANNKGGYDNISIVLLKI
ncbi:MAG: protein phosphatase 2C domain-containing protein [Syntrophorhabdaceae bacterium]|nr:protein phosphatase 2C domain-containing protein [Syntrophorhabdaceae bacterium]